MTHEELLALMSTTTWIPVGSGTFNEVSVSDRELTIEGITQKWIKKIRKLPDDEPSHSHRAVRKFIEITGLAAYVLTDDEWIAPYLGRSPASDVKTAEEVIAIYRRTRNLVLDGCGIGNFLLHEEKAVCVDVDYARRRGSVISDNPVFWVWPAIHKYIDSYTFSKAYPRPLTTSAIRSIMSLEVLFTPEQIKDHYITPAFIERLHIVRHLKLIPTVRAMDILVDLSNYRFSQLQRKLEPLKGTGQTLTEKVLNAVLAVIDDESHYRTELNTLLQSENWTFLMEDEDNKVFISVDEFNINSRIQKWVKTERKKRDDVAHDCVRVVNKWNHIHPDNPAYHVTEDIWVAPYFGHARASDNEIAAAVIKIYAGTRNLLINACEPDTFILHEGEAKCVRVGYARRKGSLDNHIHKFWDSDRIEDQLDSWKHDPTHPKPLTVSILRTIMYVERSLNRQGPVKDEYITPQALSNARSLRIHQVELSVGLMDAIVNMPKTTINVFISKLNVLRDTFGDDLTNEEMVALVKVVQLDELDEIPDDNLLDFIEALLITAPVHKCMYLAAALCLLNVIRALVAEDPARLEIKEPDLKQTPLIVALLSAYQVTPKQDVVQYFIHQGVKLDEKIESGDEHPLNGHTALDCAQLLGRPEIIELLKAAGAHTHSELHSSALLATATGERPRALCRDPGFFGKPHVYASPALPLPEQAGLAP